MKTIIYGLHLSLLLFSLNGFSQRNTSFTIDQISNDTEANLFVNSLDGFFLACIKIIPQKELEETFIISNFLKDEKINIADLSDSLGIKNYELIDFDNNGHTDLLFRGTCTGLITLLIMDMGKGKYKKIFLSQEDHVLIKVGQLNHKPILEYYYVDCEKGNFDNKEIRKDVLVYKSGRVLEYNDKVSEKEIKEIAYEAGPCFGGCPVLKMKINKERKAIFIANLFNYKKKKTSYLDKKKKEIKGTYITKIKKKNFDELITMINYIDFERAKKNCRLGSSDSPTCRLKITYMDGTSKQILDNGKNMSFALQHLYILIENLRHNQNWKKKS